MFFNHRAAAVEGVGIGHRVLAVLGLRWFEVEIEIRPSQGGGGTGPRTLWDNAQPYEIIIRVKYKGKVWEEKRTISVLMARSLEKVVASYRRMSKSVIEMVATINSLSKVIIAVFVNKK